MTHLLSVLTDRMHRPLATVRVAPLYRMCRRGANLHAAFPCHIAKVCEKLVHFESFFFLYEAWLKKSSASAERVESEWRPGLWAGPCNKPARCSSPAATCSTCPPSATWRRRWPPAWPSAPPPSTASGWRPTCATWRRKVIGNPKIINRDDFW